jgi:peptidoglycan/xylan/chitin deacetylase (PgdA/CDA1 family)
MIWPRDARAAVCVTFDNLGEAAEQEMGADTPTGGHRSVAASLPIVLEELASTELTATFFVEGVNAETYPDALWSIVDAGHEVAYHAWRHEEWGRLGSAEEDDNLARGVAAMTSLFGRPPAGFRPPGGLLGEGTLDRLRERGMRYCSPAGASVAIDRAVLLCFAWPHVDAYHLLPPFEALRSHIDGSGEAGGPERVAQACVAAVDDAIADGGCSVLVFHTWLIEAERDAVCDVLRHVKTAAERGDVWAARCGEVAEWVEDHPESFAGAPKLDTTSWLDPS